MSEEKETIKDLKANILSRIEEEKLEPCSKFRLLCTYSFFSVASFLSIVVGSVAVAVMVFTSLNMGWEFYEMTHQNLITFIFNIIPYVWLLILAFTVLIGYYNVKHTKRGYKYPLSIAMLGIVGASVVGGFTLYFLKVGYGVDHMAHKMFPDQYKEAYVMQKEMWHAPEKGRLFGMVASTSGETMRFTDIEDITWDVNMVALKHYDRKLTVNGEEVRLIGIIDRATQSVVGCLVLPGVREMKMDMGEIANRREEFKERIREHEAMATMEEPDPARKVIYKDCHSVVASQMPKP